MVGGGATQPIEDRFRAGCVIPAFEIQESEIDQRIFRQGLSDLSRVNGIRPRNWRAASTIAAACSARARVRWRRRGFRPERLTHRRDINSENRFALSPYI